MTEPNFVNESDSNPPPSDREEKRRPRRFTIVAAGLLLIALGVVVTYTTRGAFMSPVALVVVAAIGLAALLLQLRLRQDAAAPVQAPLWLTVLGVVSAVAAVLADIFHLNQAAMLVTALLAVICFAVSSVIVLSGLRKRRA